MISRISDCLNSLRVELIFALRQERLIPSASASVCWVSWFLTMWLRSKSLFMRSSFQLSS